MRRVQYVLQLLSLLLTALLVYAIVGVMRKAKSDIIRNALDSTAIYEEFDRMRKDQGALEGARE